MRYDDVGKDDVDFISCKKNNKHKWESEFVARMPFRSDYLEESEGGLYERKYLYLDCRQLLQQSRLRLRGSRGELACLAC